uniref:Uncharacterized protein n=1 Tax=Rhizophora mucronata TaxID=61149 RepID=A0A2P2ISB5_RHIMU
MKLLQRSLSRLHRRGHTSQPAKFSTSSHMLEIFWVNTPSFCSCATAKSPCQWEPSE